VSCQSPEPRMIQARSVLESVAPSSNYGAAAAGAIKCSGPLASVG
jgi:hypothetical protein